MQCNFCQYEFTLSEIQAGAECPKCAERTRRNQEGAGVSPEVEARATELAKMSPAVREAIYHHRGAQPVVVVDVNMGFWSMVVFMVKWAFAAIPAMIVICLVIWVIAVVLGGLGGLGVMLFKP